MCRQRRLPTPITACAILATTRPSTDQSTPTSALHKHSMWEILLLPPLMAKIKNFFTKWVIYVIRILLFKGARKSIFQKLGNTFQMGVLSSKFPINGKFTYSALGIPFQFSLSGEILTHNAVPWFLRNGSCFFLSQNDIYLDRRDIISSGTWLHNSVLFN